MTTGFTIWIWCCLPWAGKLGLSIDQLDVNTDSLNGDLNETIFTKQPEGYVGKKYKSKICSLKKDT